MKTNYHINTMGYIGIILIFLLTILTSCKKEENKAPTPTAPTTSTVTVDTFTLTSANSGSNVNVVDTIYKYIDGSSVKFTIPVEYTSNYDTMTVLLGTPFGSYSRYEMNHILKYNTAYRLKGSIFNGTTNGTISSSNSIYVTFQQQLSTDPNIVAGAYDLTYSKL